MNLKELLPPSSSSSSSSSTATTQEVSQPRSVPSTPTTTMSTTTTACASNEPPSAGNTTTFVLSDDAELLNSDLTQTASLSSLADGLPATITSIPPTKTRGNGNNHHSGTHSITRVKNIELIHLGKYFIKPWYFSPYPEVRFIGNMPCRTDYRASFVAGAHLVSSCLHLRVLLEILQRRRRTETTSGE